jgi:DNA-directed RNA polymerase specialized sigma24 family protein
MGGPGGGSARVVGDDDLAYLMRVLRNTFFTSRRTASRRPVTSATLEDVVVADPQPDSEEAHAKAAGVPQGTPVEQQSGPGAEGHQEPQKKFSSAREGSTPHERLAEQGHL